MDDSNQLHLLYLNLLRAAIDTQNCSKAHPGFIKAMEHMAPNDALLLQILFETVPFQWVVDRADIRPRPLAWMLNNQVPKLANWQEEDIQTGLEVLSGLCLVGYAEHDIRDTPESSTSYQSLTCWLTEYGERFIKTCMPDGFPELNSRVSTDITSNARLSR